MTRHTVNIALCFDKSHFRFTFATITTRVAQWSDVASGRSIFRYEERPRRVLQWKKSTILMFLLYALPDGSHTQDSENVRKKFTLVENFIFWGDRFWSTVFEKYVYSNLFTVNCMCLASELAFFNPGLNRDLFLYTIAHLKKTLERDYSFPVAFWRWIPASKLFEKKSFFIIEPCYI